MSDVFTASNGMKVAPQLVNGNSGLAVGYLTLAASEAAALREFFRAEEDERLGRWRWPENPDYVVYPYENYVQVLHEPTGTSGAPGSWTRADAALVDPSATLPFGSAARAYFDAHPERKPWHDATPDGVWEITTTDGRVRPAWRDPSGCWEVATGDLSDAASDSDITDARRVWPVEES